MQSYESKYCNDIYIYNEIPLRKTQKLLWKIGWKDFKRERNVKLAVWFPEMSKGIFIKSHQNVILTNA